MLSPALVAALILLIGIVVLIIASVPVAIAIGLPSLFAAMAVLGPENAAQAVTQRMFTGTNSFTLLAIPFFVLAGSLMNSGGIATRLIDAAKVLVGRMPASLANTNIAANGMFGAVSGAAVAAASAVGTVMTPRMREEGYSRPYSAAVNVASAPAGMLIPPSNTFIVYSLVSSTSIAALFMAGVGPGLLWLLAVAIVGTLLARRENYRRAVDRPSLAQALLIIWRAAPSLLMIFIVVGGILLGWFTPTESAAIAVVYCLVLGFAYRAIRVQDLPDILLKATRTTSIVMMLIAVSSALSWVMAFARIPQMISDALLAVSDSKVVILLIMMVILLLIGTVMDPTPAILIFVPIFLPVVTELGVDPVHFGAMVVMNLSLGVITPPVGNVLFVGSQVAGLRVETVIGRLWPFLAAILVALFLVVFIPQISLWLPTIMGLVGTG
ncbi:TRAP transporter, DctM subunit [Corynebacterium efficiens YS-314]|uniref:Putative C4-dicarboxylate permease large protein n=1 Tax=Corynebacterium efficiens (strain DSM 44549 / YS-314 / AJ 12310 / JCM 11189 / NBRC 100395) TaxID=196164 RepID=Q8FNA6_COREF|nr:TRAP transporter large permease [Corynebacterium efficiens]EEW49205.1 TRAP transporter, DctM subunit [Corynebacterium efficiens YS-314]BAC19049.1 putative C4-dicarboxylate permease large protein [Corynebacterium efficiens YS-314]